ncbi:MAG: SUMF1/EgtB/PvdO family nonheme iron enzyme, partial [Alphaproteobacteria bacterium]|nr:SUMF1/EgtB/PvdO family nonheme iron enzyme [Alphaproteobacteria bacterium]
MAAATMLAAGTAAAQTQDRFNPAPDPDDLVFPMPCDARMAFRKVVVPVKSGEASNWMADTAVTLGDDRDAAMRYAEAPRDLPLVGGFREADPAKQSASFYLIAKYETTAGQRTAIASLGKDCPAPAGEREMPAVGVAWFDAVEMAERYTQWLYENADAKLDKAGELHRLVALNGFFRLPTEEEWEYAARGGVAAGKNFRNPSFVEPGEPMEEYVWFAGAKSANGKLWPVGLKKPNPLHIHDILGNAAE